MMKKRVQLLKSFLSKNFPEVDVGFYLSRRSKFVHMGLDTPLYSIKNYPDFIDEINKFLAKDLRSSFELIYPQLVLTVKWKFDYIVGRKLKKKINSMNAYVPKFMPKDPPWYDRGGLMTWCNQGKCEDFLRDR